MCDAQCQREVTDASLPSVLRRGHVAPAGTLSPLARVKASIERPKKDLPEAAIVDDASLIFQQTFCSRRSRSVQGERVRWTLELLHSRTRDPHRMTVMVLLTMDRHQHLPSHPQIAHVLVAPVCDSVAHNLVTAHAGSGLPAASVRERHRQHPKGPLMM